MNEKQILENDRKKTATESVQCYLVDMKPHPVVKAVELQTEYAATTAGNLLFGSSGNRDPKSYGRRAIKHLQDVGECIVAGKGKAQTIRLAKAPKWMRGNTRALRDADAEAEATIIAVVEKGSGRLITELFDAVDQALRPKLKNLIGPDGIPEVFPFALFRRVIDRLVADGICDRAFAPHEGRQIEIIKKHEDKEKPQRGKKTKGKSTAPKEKAEANVTAISSESAPAIDLTLSEQDRQDYRSALGVPTVAQKDQLSPMKGQPLDQALAGLAPALADVVWASASDEVRKRFLFERLGDPEIIARVREVLVGAPRESAGATAY
jgi:hypothetical protein